MLDAGGFSRIRDDLAWGSVERKKGEYGIPARIDKTVAMCMEHGIKPLYIFGYPSPAYKDYKKGFPTNDITRTACAEAMAFAVGHFRGKVMEGKIRSHCFVLVYTPDAAGADTQQPATVPSLTTTMP